ncbi:MAG: hypothetical protein KGI24_05370 [Candidatus Omnitrophica bacterium]|nr:hypothetical protein [Candidatus Omnitrophota bacterium]
MKTKLLILGLAFLVLAGCATSSSYVSYTYQQFAPKDKYYTVDVYPASQTMGTVRPYYVIGKVSVEGFASDGATPAMLTSQAQKIARHKGADAIINAKTMSYRYYYYGDALLRFTGQLIVYTHQK